MSFIETPRFPDCVSLGALSKPRYKTNVIPVSSGYKARNIEWAQGLHSFDFGHNAMTQFQHDSLLDFFHAMYGMGHQFRVKDPGDFQTTIANGTIINLNASLETIGSAGVGFGVGSFLAVKKYTAGALTTYRRLQKLVSGTTTLYRGGTPVTVGVGAGQVTIDSTTGKLTIAADQTRSISSHTPGSHSMIMASAFSPNFTVGQRIYISGVTGTAATVLNNLSHVVNFVSGTQIDINTITSGLTATGGTASFYPQTTDAFTLVTQFDVPCMFSSDEAAFEAFEKTPTELLYRWSGINLEEERITLV